MEEGDRPELKTRLCSNLTTEIDSLLNDGYRLDMIMPADDPRQAILSKDDESIRLSSEGNPQSEIRNPQSKGRAGMEYRDLIPDRLGGRVIASHIRITKGGEVPDYVHYHKIKFQMIFCKIGSIRVVYEDQGPPFVLNAGDCILQPPEIRHRVLESSIGAEVIEVSSPAEHETWVEHEIDLPTTEIRAGRRYGGQLFVRHIADKVDWIVETDEVARRDTGIRIATNGMADVHVVRISEAGIYKIAAANETFIFALDGEITVDGIGHDRQRISAEECLVLPPGNWSLAASRDSEILCVNLRLS